MVESNLDSPTLVLNSAWTGIDACTAREALCDVYSDRAQIVCTIPGPYMYSLHNMESWMNLPVGDGYPTIQSTSGKILVPDAIVLKEFKRMPTRKVVFSRRNLWKRDRMRCQYCGVLMKTDEVTVDHIVPRCRGGLSTWTNCVLACITCNKKKDDKSLEKCGMRLFRYVKSPSGELVKEYYTHPTRPSWSPLFAVRRKKVPASWAKLLNKTVDDLYWDTELEP